MKNGLHYILFTLGVISLLVCCTRTLSNSNENHLPVRFVADSGYILKKEGIAFLLQIKDTSTVNVNNSTFKNTDTIGKYYQTKNGNYLACVLDIIHPGNNRNPVVFGCKPDGTILKNEHFYGGYLCCWNNNYEGFQKHGDYYSIKTCETGSGFCGGHINVFKEPEPQTHDYIPASAWSTWCTYQAEGATALTSNITSTISLKSDTIMMHYKLETLEPDESEDVNYKVINTEFFDIKYIERETGWEALDTINLSRIPM